MQTDPKDRTGHFVQLLTRHQGNLSAYIAASIGHWSDVEEVLQETNAKLWEQRDLYDSGQDFIPWAMAFAKYQVLTWWSRQRRNRVHISQAAVDLLTERVSRLAAELDRRPSLLQGCIEKLNQSSRQVIDMYYLAGHSVRDVAVTQRRSEQAIYKSLARIRKQLYDCVQRHLQEEGAR